MKPISIDKLDSNFIVDTNITEPDIVWLDAKSAPFEICGIMYDEEDKRYVRMPQNVAETVSERVFNLNRCTAGGRVRFRTNSTFLAIHAVMENRPSMPHITLLGQSGFDCFRRVHRSETPTFALPFMPPVGMTEGYSYALPQPFDGEMAEYTINFPLYDCVKELYIAVKKDSELLPPFEYLNKKPVVYYGSSITQGGCASRPGNAYQAILTRRLDVDHINLGFSGSARGEAEIADYIASLDMSVFVCDYDNNAPSIEHLRDTYYPMYKKVRDAHPDLPIIMISAPNVISHPTWAARRDVIYDVYSNAINSGDKNVYFIDGGELLDGECWDSCRVDYSHPNDLGFYRMAMRIEKDLKPLLK